MLGNIVQNRNINFGALLDFFNLFFCLDNAVVRNNVTLRFNFLNALIKFYVTFFIFLTAAAPASIISSGFFPSGISIFLKR